MTPPPRWKFVTKYRVTGGWRYVAECTRCKDTRGFSNPDDIKDASPHEKEDCDLVLKERLVHGVMDE
jgi:hypothetical protein